MDLGLDARPVVIGPVTLLKLSKPTSDNSESPLSFLGKILPLYVELVQQLVEEGAKWIQIDEPILALDLDDETKDAFRTVYAALSQVSGAQYLLATYFGGLEDNLSLKIRLNSLSRLFMSILSVIPNNFPRSLRLSPNRSFFPLVLLMVVTSGRPISTGL